VLTGGTAPRGWVEAPPAEPAWWNEGQQQSPAPVERPNRRQPDLFEAAPPTDAWIDTLISSMTYSAQRGLAGRGAPDDAVVRALIAALAKRGGRLSRTALAQMLGLPAFRTAGLVNAARRVLNVDQAQVLSIDSSADEVVLDLRLLRLQFDLREPS
jgi:hypothetical protein